jgi:hypothetical protein
VKDFEFFIVQQRVENYRRFRVQVISLAVIADDDEVAAAAA